MQQSISRRDFGKRLAGGAAFLVLQPASNYLATAQSLRNDLKDLKGELYFDDALAQVGCPDRRNDRLCITCCSPSQPSHHAGCPARSRLRRERDGFLISLALGHHGPGHPRNLVGKCDGGDRGWASAWQRREPRFVLSDPSAMGLGREKTPFPGSR